MVLELAIIEIKKGENAAFETNLEKAQAFLQQSKGYISHEFQQCMEETNKYILLIRWESLEAHTIGFRKSELFKEWRALIGDYFAKTPDVQHYEITFQN